MEEQGHLLQHMSDANADLKKIIWFCGKMQDALV